MRERREESSAGKQFMHVVLQNGNSFFSGTGFDNAFHIAGKGLAIAGDAAMQRFLRRSRHKGGNILIMPPPLLASTPKA